MPSGASPLLRSFAHPSGVLLAFGAGFAALFSPILLDGGVLGTSDALVYYHPTFVARASGWTTALYSGYPVQGDPQAMTWYPAALLFAPFGAWNAFVISGYALASSFAYGYAYAVTRSRLSSAIAGIAYGASGYAIAHLDHVTMVHGMAWAPLVLWSLELQRSRLSAGWLVVGAFGVGSSLLAGHPQIFLYMSLVLAAYGIVAGWSAPVGRARYWLHAAGMGVLGVGLAAILWLPTLELASHSTRSLVNRSEFFEFSLQLGQLPQLLFPYLLGGAALSSVPPTGPPADWPLPYFGPGRFAEVTGYVGLLPLALAGFALAARRGSRLVRFWTVTAILSVLLAMGDSLPILGALGFHVPGLNRFRVPPRHLLELALAVSCLAAIGVSAASGMDAEKRHRLTVGIALGLAAALAAGLALYVGVLGSGTFDASLHWAAVRRGEAVPWRNPALALQAVVAVIGFGALVLWSRRGGAAAGIALVAAVVLDLGSVAALGTWRMSPALDRSDAIPAALSQMRDELGTTGQRMSSLTFDAPDNAAPPNRNLLWDIPSALGYGPLLLSHYARLTGLGPAGLPPADMGRILTHKDRSFDLLAVRYLTVPDGSQPSEIVLRESLAFRPPRRGKSNWPQVVEYLERQPRFERRASPEGAVVFENTRALPRAWLVSELRVLPLDALVAAVRTSQLPDGSTFDPRRTALVEREIDTRVACPFPCGEAHLLEDSGTQLRVRSEARAETLLVVSDVDYPGWEATVDGVPAPIHRVHHALRGVVVPAGTHEVRFSFQSRSLRWGAGVTIAAGLALAGWALVLFLWPQAQGRGQA